MATPCSVKADGVVFVFRLIRDAVTFCDLKEFGLSYAVTACDRILNQFSSFQPIFKILYPMITGSIHLSHTKTMAAFFINM